MDTEMSTASTVRAWAESVRQRLAAEHANPNGSSSGLAGWLNSLLNHLNHNVLSPISAFVRTLVDWSHTSLYWQTHLRRAIGNLTAWFLNGQLKWLKGYINIKANRLHADILKARAYAEQLAVMALRLANAYTDRRVSIERAWRLRGDKYLFSEIRTLVKWLHQNIEREAISGYQLGAKDRASVITRVAELIARFAPETRFLVRQVVRGILDLLEVDNPILRIALGFVLRHIVDRLGLEKPIGQLLGRLMGSALATGKPKGLHDVVYDITSRLTALEGQWAQFMADGGAEILQAGEEWQAITTLGTDAALLAVVGLMATKPHAFARDLSNTAGVVINDAIGAITHLIEKAG
jgi:hypothetical protein